MDTESSVTITALSAGNAEPVFRTKPDATRPSLNSEIPSDNSDTVSTEGVEPSAAKSPETPKTKEDAEQVAKDFEEFLNTTHDTVIRFRVSVTDEEQNAGFRFQVVDRETGQIVRQFPPDDIIGLKSRVATAAQGQGVLFDSLA